MPTENLSDFCAYLAQACDPRPVVFSRVQSTDGAGLRNKFAALRRAIAPATIAVVALEAVAAMDVRAAIGQPAFFGAANVAKGSRAAVAVLDRHDDSPAPAGFQVLAIVPVYNEEDVIEGTLADLTQQGVHVYLLDNWSTDGTIDRARRFLRHGLLSVERFPHERPSATYDLRALLHRVEQIAFEQQWADWIVLHDADERRRSPWPGVNLRDALWRVERSGFNCVDHVTLNFWPVDDSFHAGILDLEQHFRYFEFSRHAGHFHQRRAWKQTGSPVSLAATAGHDVSFPGRRVYPYKFLLKHYPVRSQRHGEEKVMQRRRQRWNASERALGWHRQYDGMQSFLRDASTLQRFAPSFYHDFLIERLSGVGIFREPPPWATPPTWVVPPS